ncbi:hypothetical protein L7F22_040204 [Adiantum nelumboides]|nr:hypothetical protein [Adiantum nelumboides]
MVMRLALEIVDKPYDLPASSNASWLTIRLADGCSEGPRCVFSALNCVKLQRGPSEHPSASRITIRFALEFAGKPYDLPASSNAKRITIRIADGYSEGLRCVFSALNYVKLQRGSSEHTSTNCITIQLALELAGKPCDLPASSKVRRITIQLADGCLEDPRCVFNALYCVKFERGPSEYISASCITIQLALELVGKPYDLPATSNSKRIIKRLAYGCSKGSRCVFSALDSVNLQREPFEHPLASRITIRLALELVGNSYDLSASYNASRLTIRLADGCSKALRCVFCALDCVKLQRVSYEHPSANRITIRLALKFAGKPYDLPTSSNAKRITKRLAHEYCEELGGKPYDLPASSNARRLTIRLVDGCSERPRCVFSALDCIKLQREPSEHPLANRITIRFALELANKPYDLLASPNTKRITIRLADECSEGPGCVFNALNYVKLQHEPSEHTSASRKVNYVKLQRGPSEHTSESRITIRLALEFAEKPYDLPVSSNARRITKRLADGCSKGPRCVFSALDSVKLQSGPFEYPSVNRVTIRLALELAGKLYDLPTSSNASRLTIRLVDGCSKSPRCVFSALNCIKLQRGSYEHPSASRITIWIALKFAGKPYDLSASSNAIRITKRLGDVYSEGTRCVFSALNWVKLQRKPFEHTSASRITIRIALEFVGKPYDLPASKAYDLPANSNASRLTIRLADRCSKNLRCIFSALNYVKSQCGPSKHPSTSRMESLRCVFSALNCIKLQRGSFEHPSASHITIRLALELVGKPYDLSARSNASRLTIRLALELGDKPYDLPISSNASRFTIRLADVCSKGPRCVFNALYCVKLQRGTSEHPSANRITIRFALEIAGKTYDLPASSNAKRITIRSALRFQRFRLRKVARGPSEHTSASRITIRFALEFVDKSYDLPASSNAKRITIRIVDGCSEDLRCVFNALDCVKLQRGPSEHLSASRITIRLALELAEKPYDLLASSNAKRITKRIGDERSEGSRYVFSALNSVKLQRGPFEHPSASRITIRLALELPARHMICQQALMQAGLPYGFPMGARKVRVAFSAL